MYDNRGVSLMTGCVGAVMSSIDLYTTLSYILLVLSIINIGYGLIYSIYNHIKNKQYDKIDDDVQDAQNKIEEIINKK